MRNKLGKILLIIIFAMLTVFTINSNAENTVFLGDINKDRAIDTKDLIIMERHIFGFNNKHSEWVITGEEYEIADITKNGLVNGSDLLVMLRYIAAKNNPEEIGNDHPEWIEAIENEENKFEMLGVANNPRTITIGVANEYEDKEVVSQAVGIQLNKTELEIKTNEICKLEAKLESGLSGKVEWETDNKEVAEIYGDGMIVGKKSGEATITAKLGKQKATCKVKVIGREDIVNRIVLNKNDIELDAGEKEKIEATIEPTTAKDKEITYKVGNSAIAEVESDGTVIGKMGGTTPVIVTSDKQSAVCVIKVKENEEEIGVADDNISEEKSINEVEVKVNRISLDNTELTMQENQLRRLNVKVEPESAEVKEITWNTSNAEIAEVDSKGLITGKKAGEATITAKVGDKQATCKVTVEKTKLAVLGLSLSTNSVEVEEDSTIKIIAAISPKEASNREIGIEIDNEDNAIVENDYVTVDEEGKAEIEVRGTKVGKAVLTVSSGAIKKTCDIIIKPKSISANKLTLSKNNINIYKDQTVKLEATIEPENSTEEITWTTANDKIAVVDKDGKVTAKNKGRTEIIAKTHSGLEGKCKVTVKTKATGINTTESSKTIEMEKLGSISALTVPSGSEIKDIEWTNSNQDNLALERIIENGTYYIKSAINDKKVLDVANGSTSNKAAIQLFDGNGTEAQKFEITSLGNEYYTIKSKKSGKVLDVVNGGKAKGTKIQQYTSNGTDAQKWEFEYAGAEKYYIRSKVSGLYLDVTNGKAENRNQLQVWTGNKSNAQKFKLEQIDKKEPIVEDGTYYIKSALNEKKVLDIRNASDANKTAVQVHEKNNTDAQKFELTSVGNGYYVIRARSSGKAMDVKNGGTKSGTKVQQFSYNSTDAQLWRIEKSGDYYRFKSKNSGLYLDVTGAKAENEIQLQVYNSNNTKAQKFKLEKESDETKLASIGYVILKGKKEGKSTITAKLSNGKTAQCSVDVKSSKITGGQAIAEAAVQLACSVAPKQGRYKVDWPWTVVRNSRTSFYIDTRDKYIKGSYAGERNYASCDVGVATAVRYAGVDKNMEWRNTPLIWEYVPHSWEKVGSKKNGWIKVGTFARSSESTSKLQPGDVLLSGQPYGHIWLYTGNAAVKKKYPTSNADGYEAGYWTVKGESYYPHLFNINSDARHHITFTIFRHENANKKEYDKILK